jgi:hypothetical protein
MPRSDDLLNLLAIKQALSKSVGGVGGPQEVFDRRLIHVTYSAQHR